MYWIVLKGLFTSDSRQTQLSESLLPVASSLKLFVFTAFDVVTDSLSDRWSVRIGPTHYLSNIAWVIAQCQLASAFPQY